jgi:hypothetical protein
MQQCTVEGEITVEYGATLWVYAIVAGKITVDQGQMFGFGLTDVALVGAAADDIAVTLGPNSSVAGLKFTGGYATSSGQYPLVSISGIAENIGFDTTSVDRGAGALVLVDDGARVVFSDTFTGDNANAGGHGLEVRYGSFASVPRNGGLTGDSGSTTTMYLGSDGLVAYANSAQAHNDLIADPAGTEEMVIVKER